MPSRIPACLLPISRLSTVGLRKALFVLCLLAAPMCASAADKNNKDNRRGTCATTYTVVQQDDLGNIEQQGISNAKNRKWADKDLWKHYPDVCYLAPGPAVKAIFVITTSEYGKLTLTVETFAPGGKAVIQRSFQQCGIYPTMYASSFSVHVHHPAKELIEDAVKWIHEGGLDNTL